MKSSKWTNWISKLTIMCYFKGCMPDAGNKSINMKGEPITVFHCQRCGRLWVKNPTLPLGSHGAGSDANDHVSGS